MADGILLNNFNTSRITSFKTGGRAKYYFIPDSIDSLKDVIKDEKIYVVGNCTNLLISDNGFDGMLVNLKGFTSYISFKRNLLISGSSVKLDNLIKFAIDRGLKGLERLSGIPGTVGGGLYMNAGAFDSEIGNRVEYVRVLSYKGREKIFKKNEIDFFYRGSKPLDKYIIIEAGFKLYNGNKKELAKTRKEILSRREKKQPVDLPSAGSVFKRPKNYYAGALVEQAGCKGLKIGGAMVSEKHSNFIVNMGNATSDDIYRLIKEVQKRVYKKFKIKLEPEIKFLGF